MKIHNYVLVSSTYGESKYRENIVDDVIEGCVGYVKYTGVHSCNTYYRHPVLTKKGDLYEVAMASENPIPNAKSVLCEYMEEVLQNECVTYVSKKLQQIVLLQKARDVGCDYDNILL